LTIIGKIILIQAACILCPAKQKMLVILNFLRTTI